ncbi:hypothetical protein N7513_012268 [Penicillium frequentans]|nr:hypothetical protein N7513_012268 [Penicillium glabrum]
MAGRRVLLKVAWAFRFCEVGDIAGMKSDRGGRERDARKRFLAATDLYTGRDGVESMNIDVSSGANFNLCAPGHNPGGL